MTWSRMPLPRRVAGRLLGPSYLDELGILYRVLRAPRGVMVDVGAHWGESLDPFARDGWSIYAFEPDPGNLGRLREATAQSPSVVIDNRAVSDQDGAVVPLYTSDVSSGISTLSPFHSSHRLAASVRTVRLDTYLQDQGVDQVEVLKVDAEGHDLNVLRGFPWQRLRPRLVFCEFEDRKTVPLGHTYRELADLLGRQGYSVIVSEWFPIVEYGRRHSWRRASVHPGRVAEGAWGNLVAVPARDVRRCLWALRLAGNRLRLRRWVEARTGRAAG